jgi:hypothetical protein
VSPTSNETDNQAISQALECLQNAAKLANILGTVFAFVVAISDRRFDENVKFPICRIAGSFWYHLLSFGVCRLW